MGLFLFLFLLIKPVSGGFMYLNTTVPLRENPVRLSCFSNTATKFFLYNTNIQEFSLTSCSVNACFDEDYGRNGQIFYKFGISSGQAYVDILSLNRTRDETVWRCLYENDQPSQFNLTVFSIPQGLNFTQEGYMNTDLSMASAVLECTTNGCTYPPPVIQWLYRDQSVSTGYEVFRNSTPTGTLESCVLPEKVYTSKLNLDKMTTLNDNSDRTVTFSCRIEYPEPAKNIVASGTKTVTFAVRVTSAVIQQNNMNITNTLNVTSGEALTLTCVTGTSRPSPVINWYIGSEYKGNGTSLIFTPSTMDHDKIIYCLAYNTDPNLNVSSNKPKLYVRVRVTEAVLQQNNRNITDSLNVTLGEQATLSCLTGTSRPAPTIDWYIGSEWQGSGTNLTFIPSNMDHNEIINCQAYNIDSNQKVYSSTPKLYVRVRVTEAVLQQNNQNITETLTVTSAEPVTLTCVTGTSRPAPTIDWYLGSQKRGSGASLTINFINIDHNEMIYCQAYNTDPSRLVSSAKPRLFVRVRVTEVVLQQNNQNITEILTVTSSEQVTLTCVTGSSRPAPTIDWYIGSQKRGSGPSLTIAFSNMDHNEIIFCQAFNTDPSKPVSSAKPRLFVRAAPIILDVSPDYKGYVGQYIMIQFDFYSNTKENLTVTAQHSNSSGLINQGIIRPTLPDDLGDSPPVPAADFRATLVISINSKNDFGLYEIKVKNSIGSDSKSIRIIEQITPEKPVNFHATNIQEKQLSLMWQSRYRGRYTQTFVVEISLDNITWINVSQVSAGNSDGWISTTFGNLIPGSEYYLRLYAYNINGRGDFADVQLPIRMLKESGCTFSLEVGAGVGIGVGGVVLGLIGAVIAFTIRRQLNGPKNSCLRSKGKTDDAMHTYSNTEMNPQTVKPIYEELNKENTGQTVYDKISPL